MTDAMWTAVIWNLSEGRHPKPQSWEALSGFDADIALLSEARFSPGPEIIGHGKTIGRDCKHESEDECQGRPFSTAVVSRYPIAEIVAATARRHGRALDIPFRPSRPGTWAAATVSLAADRNVSAVSLYGLTDEKSDASVHRSLSDLEPIFEDPAFNELLLLGGDLNILANPRPKDAARDRHLIVLDRIKAYGLVDLFERDSKPQPDQAEPGGTCPCGVEGCSHVWTFRSRDKRRAHIRYQDDHVFASPALADKLKSCRSLGFRDASDHAPILAEFWL